jgi:hypothetical protein
MPDTIYRIVKQPGSTYSVVVVVMGPDLPRRGAGGFRTKKQAEEWVEGDKRRSSAPDDKDTIWYGTSHGEGPAHWRGKAAEVRRIAETLATPKARRHLLTAAASFDRLAALLEKAPIPKKSNGVNPDSDSL